MASLSSGPVSEKLDGKLSQMPVQIENVDEDGEAKVKANLHNATTANNDPIYDKFEHFNSKEVNLMQQKVLITICSGDRKKKKAFMSIPKRKEVIEKARKYDLNGTTLVLESNGCEICEDEVLEVFSKEKSLLMLLSDNEEYIPLPQPYKNLSMTTKRNKQTNCASDTIYYADNSIVSNANDSTLSNDETLSFTSISHSGSNVKMSSQFVDFAIPWQKVPDHIMKLLREKSSLGKRLNTLANVLVDELRERGTHIPIRVFRQVAQQAAEKYPDSLLEKDREGQLIARTPQSLISKMINRNNSLKRPIKRANSLSSSPFENHISNKKRKSIPAVVNSNSKISPSLNESLVQMKNLLIESRKGEKELEREVINNYMKQCFPLQRTFFNNNEKIPDIAAIKENWPYIFDKEILYQHFELLMSINPRNLERHLRTEREQMFRFFRSCSNKKINSLAEINTANIFRGLAYYFNENPDYIFKFFENGSSAEFLENANPTNAPWIAIVKNHSEDDFTALIFIEGKIMVKCDSESSSFADLITQLLCFYYTFNMMYPKEATLTLEFVVFYFLKEPIRSLKKVSTGNSKFNHLIAKLTNPIC